MPGTVRVAVNGYGVIGKRLADAVRAQPDMELVGVSDVTAGYRIRTALVLGLPVYASVGDRGGEMEAAGAPVAGTVEDLLGQVGVVVDCTWPRRHARRLVQLRPAPYAPWARSGPRDSSARHAASSFDGPPIRGRPITAES